MKQICLIVILSTSVYVKAYSQYTVDSNAKKDFTALFYLAPFKWGSSWSDRLTRVNAGFFFPGNGYLSKYFNELLKGKDEKEAGPIIYALADSLNSYFLKEHAFDSAGEDLARLQDILPEATAAICGCINGKLKYTDSIQPGEGHVMSDCAANYYKDLHKALRVNLAFAGYDKDRAWNGTQTLMRYVTINCKAILNFQKTVFDASAAEQYYTARSDQGDEMADLVTQLYAANKIDSLKKIFPNYLPYKIYLELFKQIHANSYNKETNRKNDTLIVSHIYSENTYTNPHVNGELDLYLSDDVVPILYKFIYTPRSKMTNVALVEKKLKQEHKYVPPPPQEDIVAPPKN